MLLIDKNQLCISAIFAQLGSDKNRALSESLVRHIVLANILHYKKKFGKEYGQIVLATDDRDYWRRDVFPYYKAHRKKNREDSGFDWNLIFKSLNTIRTELKESFPYKVIQVPKCEADDIIGTLCAYSQENDLKRSGLIEEPQPIMIISGDKDFIQLQKYKNIKQYSPMQKKFLTSSDPARTLKEHIIRGDSGDGIPNFLSNSSVFVDGKKQSPIYTKKLVEWLDLPPEKFCTPEQIENYNRNKQIIDLSYIPNDIQKSIIEEYEKPLVNGKEKLFNYFLQHRLPHLMDDLGAF